MKNVKGILYAIATLFIAFFMVGSSIRVEGQVYSKFEADFSVKEMKPDGTKSLTMGTVFFNKIAKTIVFDITFPQKEVMLINDSIMYRIVDEQLINEAPANNTVAFSVFQLCLNGDLPYFGLKNTVYKLQEVNKEKDMVISSWKLPDNENGSILLSQKDKQLFGMISYGMQDSIVSKQFFEDYQNLDGLDFPSRIVQFFYTPAGENVKVTTYKNIILNNDENGHYYNYPIPFN